MEAGMDGCVSKPLDVAALLSTMQAAVPQIPTFGLDTTPIAPPTPHKMSGRRLSKSVMRADSHDGEGSKGWGLVSLEDGSGTPRAVRGREATRARGRGARDLKSQLFRARRATTTRTTRRGRARRACASNARWAELLIIDKSSRARWRARRRR